MKTDLFSKAIASNKKFWSRENVKDVTNGCLLYEVFYSDPVAIYGISKTALSIAKIKSLKPICIAGITGSKENHDLINSMNGMVIRSHLIASSLKNLFSILIHVLSINDKKKLINLKIDNCEVGPYIYDAVLRRLYLPEISNIDINIKKVIGLELAYFYLFKYLIKKFTIKAIVLGDNVYRPGILFELAKHNNIECIAPININNFSMKKYCTFEEFNIHYRKPEKNILDRLENDTINKNITEYFQDRFSANIEQHDVIRAFDESKKIFTKDEIIKQYGLEKNLPIIIVMSHIFCDAPHSYPCGLYDDYKEWFISTVKALKQNKNINFLVKEHPSAELYKESGLVKKFLRSLECEQKLLKKDVHNLTILDEFDVVVTCGGTIGLEFAYKGKPVILSSKPPYSGFGFTIEPKSKEEYESFLKSGVEHSLVLNQEQKDIANKVIYYDFILLDNYSDELEIGNIKYCLGGDVDYIKLYNNILKYNETPLIKQKVYKKLQEFICKKNKHLLGTTYDY